jgi:cationic amino acid transporter 4
MIGGVIGNATEAALGTMHEDLLSKRPDVLAAAVCLVYAALLAVGVKASSVVNSALTLVNMVVMLFVIVLGFAWAPGLDNWQIPSQGFLPFGFSGVVAGAATCFYAFVGFDSIATAGEEAKDLARSIPVATITSMLIVMVNKKFILFFLRKIVIFLHTIFEFNSKFNN